MGDGSGAGRNLMILDNELYMKTDAGRDEIANRSQKLASGLRSMLLLVDGRRDAGLLRKLGAGLHAAPDALDQLLAMGLIADAEGGAAPAAAASGVAAPSDVALRYTTLSALMSEAVREHLGLRGFFMQLKIERCNDVAELQALLPDLADAVGKSRGREYARGWERSVRAAIAS